MLIKNGTARHDSALKEYCDLVDAARFEDAEEVLKHIEGGKDKMLLESLERRKRDEKETWNLYKRSFVLIAMAALIMCYPMLRDGLINIKSFLNFHFLGFLFISGFHIITYRGYKFYNMFRSVSKVHMVNVLLPQILFTAFIFSFFYNLSR
jgi:hypothetical protein